MTTNAFTIVKVDARLIRIPVNPARGDAIQKFEAFGCAQSYGRYGDHCERIQLSRTDCPGYGRQGVHLAEVIQMAMHDSER